MPATPEGAEAVTDREAEQVANWTMAIVGLAMMAIVVGVLILNSWMANSFRVPVVKP